MLYNPLSSKTHNQSVIKFYWVYHSGMSFSLFSNLDLQVHSFSIYAPNCHQNYLSQSELSLCLIFCNYYLQFSVWKTLHDWCLVIYLLPLCHVHDSPNFLEFWTMPPCITSLCLCMCWPYICYAQSFSSSTFIWKLFIQKLLTPKDRRRTDNFFLCGRNESHIHICSVVFTLFCNYLLICISLLCCVTISFLFFSSASNLVSGAW